MRSSLIVVLALGVIVNAEDNCSFSIVESIPEALVYPENAPSHIPTHQAWMSLIDQAQKSIDIASFYWTLRNSDVPPGDNSSWQGEEVFQGLMNAALKRGIKVRIAQNKPSSINPAKDTEILAKLGAAEVRTLDFDKIIGAGVLHTKFWIIDDLHVYVGSANMDFRALTQVKELGSVISNCSTLAADLKKVFEVYWELGATNKLPSKWSTLLATQYNQSNPLTVNLNASASDVFISSSPPQFSPSGRSDDLESIVGAIDEAKKFVYVAVMDFYPQIIYGGPSKNRLWLPLESALRRAAIERGVDVRLLVSEWKSTRKSMKAFVASLGELGKVFKLQTRKFVVPPLSPDRQIPFTRVNHNKYFVTDREAFIGTSNWSGDYFINTAGVGLHIQNAMAVAQLKGIFLRDWNSKYSHGIYDDLQTYCV